MRERRRAGWRKRFTRGPGPGGPGSIWKRRTRETSITKMASDMGVQEHDLSDAGHAGLRGFVRKIRYRQVLAGEPGYSAWAKA